jgi:DNA-binding SARP family transcriptional activator/tetratricopeptide (TPR) repeat protein
MNVTLNLQVLGGFALRVAERPIAIGGTRLHALLAYLVLHPGAPQSRQQIAARFWPEVPEAQGRNNLRQLVHQLRQAWPDHDEWMDSDARAMQWRSDPRARVDAVDFESEFAAARGMSRGDRSTARAKLAAIARTYAGDLLPDCYDEWIVPHRDRLHGAALGALDLAVRLAEEQHDHPAAVAHAEHLLRLDPLEERTYLRLMRLHALNGDPAAAQRVYRACVSTLQRELGATPGAEIRDAQARLVRRSEVRSEPRPRPGSSLRAGEAPPLVGRAAEWLQLLGAWHHVHPRAAVLALVTGEAGLGKTRLGEEMLRWADAQGIAVARTRAYAAEGRLAFSPITGWLRSGPVREALARLDPLWRTEVARLISELLVEQPDLPRPAPLAEYWQRQPFFEALARGVTGAAPALVLLLDDLQWCDGDTLEWLHYLLRFAADVRLLVVGTIRIDEIDAKHAVTRLATALRRTDQLVLVPLTPLDAAETAKLAAGIAGKELDSDAAFRLFSQTEGNPLFVVETMRVGLPTARRDADVAGHALPPMVHSLITGRLNQLSPDAREVAALAATIGRAFSIDVLSRACDLGEPRVTRALDELWQRRIVRDGGAAGEGGTDDWDFTHDRLREGASSEQSPIQRQRHHRRIAEALESARAGDLDAVSAEIASHYDQAREPARALPYYERAARIAARVFAYDEVQALLRRALALLDRLPEASRPALELPLQVALSAAIQVNQGWASPALEPVNARAFELSRSVGDGELRARILLNALAFNEVRADLRRVNELRAELPAAMRGIDSPALRVMASTVELGAHVLQGRFAQAEAAYLAAQGIYRPEHHPLHVELIGADSHVLGCSWSSHGLWCLGRVEAALERAHESLALARALGHPFSKALALSYLATLHQMCGDLEPTRAFAAEARAISERHRVLYYGAWAGILLAWAAAAKEPGEGELATLRRSIEDFTATGARARLPYYLSLLAGLQASRHPRVALGTLGEALALSASHGDTWWDAELHRMRGELLRWQGEDEEAIAELRRAVSIAEEQGAAMLERRALDSLSRSGPNARPNG